MRYINASALLPDALVKELQGYVQGAYIYVPVAPAQQKHWGEASGYRQELRQRNRQITEAYRQGTPVEQLRNATACPSMPSGRSSIKNNRRTPAA